MSIINGQPDGYVEMSTSAEREINKLRAREREADKIVQRGGECERKNGQTKKLTLVRKKTVQRGEMVQEREKPSNSESTQVKERKKEREREREREREKERKKERKIEKKKCALSY
jgi:hypothetical protein